MSRKVSKLAAEGLLFVGCFFLTAAVRSDDQSAALYKQKCAACHGADGKGDTAAGKKLLTKPFRDPDVTKMSDDDFATVIDKGKNKMPAYGKTLKADDIKALVAYVRGLGK
jgi:cytochrome c6